jgi:hypothetical protein
VTGPIIDGGNASSTYATGGAVTPSTAGGVFAPDIATYATRTPYITAAEFTEAGTGVDVGQLVPNGTSQANAAALTRAITRASAWADNLVNKVLGATLDTQAGYYRVRDGILRVPVNYAPVIEVVSVSTGDRSWSLTPMSSLTQVGIRSPKVVEIGSTCWSGRRYVSVTYVNGWTCTTLAGSGTAGDTTVTLAANLGVYPGLVLTVDDGANTEVVQVASSYTPGAAGPVPIASPLAFPHAVGVAASAMPQDIKQAVILLTAAVIKTRGNEALVMASLSSEPTMTSTQAGGSQDVAMAKALLQQYGRAA